MRIRGVLAGGVGFFKPFRQFLAAWVLSWVPLAQKVGRGAGAHLGLVAPLFSEEKNFHSALPRKKTGRMCVGVFFYFSGGIFHAVVFRFHTAKIQLQQSFGGWKGRREGG